MGNTSSRNGDITERHDISIEADLIEPLIQQLQACDFGCERWSSNMTQMLGYMTPEALLLRLQEGETTCHANHACPCILNIIHTLDSSARAVLFHGVTFHTSFSLELMETLLRDEEVDLFDGLHELQEHGLLLVQQDSQGVMHCCVNRLVYADITRYASTYSTTFGVDFTQLYHKHARLMMDLFEDDWNTFQFFIEDDPVYDRMMRYTWDLENAYHRSVQHEWSHEAGFFEEALALNALQVGQWSRAHEYTTDWRCEDEHKDVLLSHKARALTYLLIVSRSDRPGRGLQLGRAWLDMLASEKQQEHVLFRLTLIIQVAEIASHLENFDDIEPLVELGLELCDRPAWNHQKARLLLICGLKSIYERDWPRAQAMVQEAEHLFASLEQPRYLGLSCYHLGHIYKNLWREAEALKAYEDALLYGGNAGDTRVLVNTYRELGWMWLDKVETTKALACVEALEELARTQPRSSIRGVQCMLKGQLLMQQGVADQALVELETARWHLAASQQQYLLVAALYFEFLCYWSLGHLPQAQGYLELGKGLSEELTSLMARTCYGCATIASHVWESRYEEAEQEIKALEDLHRASLSIGWLGCLLDVHRYHKDLHKYLDIKKKSSKKARELASVLVKQGIILQLQYNKGGVITEFNGEVRFCWRMIQAKIPAELMSMIELGLLDPSGEALILDRGQGLFRAPEQGVWCDMKRRVTPFKLLCALVDQHIESPGEPIDPADLFEAVWPGESILQESAQNRLYVTMNTLRKEGLKGYIVNSSEGYSLLESMRLIEI